MSNQTVTECIGSLSDSEANTQQAGWYDHNENFVFTICPNGAASIIINFSFFNTEPINKIIFAKSCLLSFFIQTLAFN